MLQSCGTAGISAASRPVESEVWAARSSGSATHMSPRTKVTNCVRCGVLRAGPSARLRRPRYSRNRVRGIPPPAGQPLQAGPGSGHYRLRAPPCRTHSGGRGARASRRAATDSTWNFSGGRSSAAWGKGGPRLLRQGRQAGRQGPQTHPVREGRVGKDCCGHWLANRNGIGRFSCPPPSVIALGNLRFDPGQ